MSRQIIDNDTEMLYFNFRIDNVYDNVPDAIGVADPTYQIPVRKRANLTLKTGELLPRQSDYKFAVDFFNIRPNIPVFFFEILEGLNTDINAGSMGMCLTHTASGDNYPQRLTFFPDTSAAALALGQLPTAPIDNNGLQDFSTNPYYYAVWTFQHMMQIINNAMYSMWAAMVADHPADSPAAPPYVVYDEPSGRICFILHQQYVRSPRAEIYMNTQLEESLEALRVELMTGYFLGDATNFKEFRLITTSARPYELATSGAFGLPAMSDILAPPAAGDVSYLPWKDVGATEFYIMMQEYETRYFWNNIRSIVFFSSSIAVRSQFLPIPNNPNAIRSTRVSTLTLASPSVLTSQRAHGLSDGDTIYIYAGSYSVSGVPVPANSVRQYIARNTTSTTLQLYSSDGATPINVTAFNPAVTMWVYKKISNTLGQFNSPSRSILAYFDIITNGGVDWRQNLYNNPNYRRWYDLTDNTALTGIDLDIYLELDNGSLIPFLIDVADCIDIKFVFKKKGVSD